MTDKGGGGEEPAHKKAKKGVAETVEVAFEGHTQVCRCMCSFDYLAIIEYVVCSFGGGISVYLPTSLLLYRRRKERGSGMKHHPPLSHLSVVLRPLLSSHLPLHTLLNSPLRWLYPLLSLHHLLNWDHLEQSRYGYASAV